MDDDKIPGDVTADFERKKGSFVLRLYRAGNSPWSPVATIENVKKIGKEYLEARYELEIFDIYQDQTKISEDLIPAAPTLIRRLRLPLRRVIRDTTKKDKVLHRARPDPKDLMSAGEGST